MGQTFSEYLYYDQEELKECSNDSENIFFEEDCLVTSCTTKEIEKFNPKLETINEETCLNTFVNENVDAYSKEYVRNIFLIAKKSITNENNNEENQNFDLIYPIKLQKDLGLTTTEDYRILKENYDSLVYDHEMLKTRFDKIKSSFDLLTKNYQILKKAHTKYKFD